MKTQRRSPQQKDEGIYCIRCKASLSKDHALCTNCDWPFDANNASTFSLRRPGSEWRDWLPALLLSVVVGIIGYALILKLQSDDLGVTLFFLTPVVAGMVFGCSARLQTWGSVFWSLMTITAIVFGLVAQSLAGLLCGLTLCIIFLLPFMLGVWCGRKLMKFLPGWRSGKNRTILALIVFTPILMAVLEKRITRENALSTVTTVDVIEETPENVWNHIAFYEELSDRRTWWLKLGLPRPVRLDGRRSRVGDVARCIYEQGHIVKRMTAVEKPSLLSFDVVEQSVHFERDVQLVDGEFRLLEIAPGMTRIEVRTRFRSKLHPTWLWSPMEKRVVKALHNHVIAGVRQNIIEAQRGSRINLTYAGPSAEPRSETAVTP